MGSFSSPLGTLSVAIEGDISGIKSALDQVVEAAEKADAEISRLDFAGRMADSVAKNMDDVRKQFEGLADVGQGMMTVGAGLTAAITAPLAGIGVAAVSTAEQLNTAKVAFTTMLGSAEAADKMLTSLQQFAATTPFEFPDLVASAQRMKALGFNAEQIIPTLRSVGDTAAAMGKGKEAIDGITTALGQMQQKGKVSAEEMMQLAERGIPAWEILARAIGVSVPEAMKLAEKGAVEASQAVPALLAGMNEKFGGSMEAMSKTLTGQWSNMKDQLTLALIPIGQAIVPALQQLLPVLTAVLEKVGEAVTWFGQLPGPIQAAAGIVATFAAAIGPVVGILGGIASAVAAAMPALTAVAGFFGTSVALLAPWALAIGAVLAALTALGVWVYQNWEPITAVLKQAWEGIQENWTAVWNGIANATKAIWAPIVAFFTTVWDAVAPYFTKAWKAIAGALSTVWNGIKETASAVWNGITAVFQKFLEWAAKIPGVNKLLNLDEAWKSAEKAAKGLNETADAAKKTGDASAAAAPKIQLVAGANKEAEAAAKKAAKAAGDHARAVADAWDAAHKRYDVMAQEFARTLKWFEDAYARIKELDAQIAKSTADLATDYAKAHERIRSEATKTVEIAVPLTKRIPEEIQNAIKANKELEESYKMLGVTSSAELNRQYQEAVKAYEKITASGKASPRDIDAAWVAMEEARQKAVIAAGEKIPEEQRKMLEKMKAQLEGKLKEEKSIWKEWAADVQNILSTFLSDVIGRLIFGGDDTNKQLDAEADALRKSLDERTQEWDAYVNEVAGKQAQLTQDYLDVIAEEEQKLADSLDERGRKHEEFVEKENERYARESEKLDEELTERIEAYNEYEAEIAEHLEEFREKAAQRLADETNDLLNQLADRQEAYDEFVEDANKKLNRLGEDTADNIDDETRDTQRGIREKKKDYDRYAQDVARKIEELRKKNGGQVTKEEEELRLSLQRRKEDLDQYIADQEADLAEYTEEQRTRQAREEEDVKTSMDRRAEDHQQYIDGVKAKFAENESNYKTSLANEETEAKTSLDKRKGDLEKFVTDTNTKRDEITAAHKTALATEETDYATFVTNATAKSEERKNNIKGHYEAETAALNTELGKQKTEYENFVKDITGPGGKLDQLKEAHRTVWSDIADLGKGAIGAITQSLTDLVSDEFMKSVFDVLKGKKGFGGLADSITDVGEIFKGIFGKGGTIEQGAKTSGDAISGIGGGGGAGGGGGGAGAAVGAGLSGWIGAISGAVTAISSVIGNFQMAGMNKTLDLIERYTRYSEIHLKAILETGVNKWLAKLDTINGWLWDTFTPAFTSLMTTTEDIPEKIKKTNDNLRDWLKPIYDDTLGKWKLYEDRLYDITDNTFWVTDKLETIKNDIATCKLYLDTMKTNSGAMKDSLTSTNKTWTVTFMGDPIASMVGQEIMRQLRLQGVNLV